MLQVCLKGREKQKSWYMDSGCSRHMTGDRSLFLTLTMKEGGTMGFGGNQNGKIIGSGTIGNSSVSINNAWLVDGLKHNLLIMVENLKMSHLNYFVKNMESSMNSLLLELHTKWGCREKE